MHRAARVLLVLSIVALVGVPGCSKKAPTVVPDDPAPVESPTQAETPTPAPPETGPTWPLTGLDAPSADVVTTRVISVKVENSRQARPQTNLQAADVVYESVTEGGITRFNALFHSQAPEVVGPVRSARLSDLDIVPQYDAVLAHAGADQTVIALMKESGMERLSALEGVSRPYTRSSARKAPHNLYASVPKLRAEVERRGMPTTRAIDGLSFDEMTPVGGLTATTIKVPFSGYNQVTWTYDATAGVYLRQNEDKPFMDAGTGKQLAARNVIVLWATHTPDVGQTFDIELGGSGRATVFRDGQAFEGTWEATSDAPPQFTASAGTHLSLRPGNTWFQVIDIPVKITTR
ncbi:MAG: DUF3048 domain-containing protein [Coriobacteriia bacterium]